MAQFALSTVSPRCIAWLLRENEWSQFEHIVKLNCAMLGGYFNVFIPLLQDDLIPEEYRQFLSDYDPDLLILPPGTKPDKFQILEQIANPFAIVPWELTSRFANTRGFSGGTGLNQSISNAYFKNDIYGNPYVESQANKMVAIWEDSFLEQSKYAFVACGESYPEVPQINVMDDYVDLSATGSREMFLRPLVIQGKKPHYVEAHVPEEEEENDEEASYVEAPNQYKLSEIIDQKFYFPLTDSVKILEASCKLQHFPFRYFTMINLTASYKRNGGTAKRANHNSRPPAMVILISENFSLKEAVLVWNLRACEIYVSWLQYSYIETDLDAVRTWIDSDLGGGYYSLDNGMSLVLSTTDDNTERVQQIVNKLEDGRTHKLPTLSFLPPEMLVTYNYNKPHIQQSRVIVAQEAEHCSFIPMPSESGIGTLGVTLEWDNLMVPRSKSLFSSEPLVSLIPFPPFPKSITAFTMPTMRVTNSRYVRWQIENEMPIQFHVPSFNTIVNSMLLKEPYYRIEQSSAAKFHLNFILRAGSLETAAYYLSRYPYDEIFRVLSNNADPNLNGMVLKYPDKRRVLNHLQLRELLSLRVPDDTQSYFKTVSDDLSHEVIEILEKKLLERGLELKCNSCSYKSWYPLDKVGQTFECSRCFQTQVYHTHPQCLYKLPEVIFQGFDHDMHVPLLAVDYLNKHSKKSFDWMPDSDIYWREGRRELHRNIDILGLSDGRFFIGEAKSDDEVTSDQLSFYTALAQNAHIDILVFATSKVNWKDGTIERFNEIQSNFAGDVLVLTKKDLYSLE